jgi:hypothetical protein
MTASIVRLNPTTLPNVDKVGYSPFVEAHAKPPKHGYLVRD